MYSVAYTPLLTVFCSVLVILYQPSSAAKGVKHYHFWRRIHDKNFTHTPSYDDNDSQRLSLRHSGELTAEPEDVPNPQQDP